MSPDGQPPGVRTRKPQHPNITFSFAEALQHFETHLRAQLKSPETIASYGAAVNQAASYLASVGLSADTAAVTGEHLEMFLADLAQRVSSATVVNRFKGLRAFFQWLREEGEIRDNPMARLKWPALQEKPPDALTPEDVKKMLATCDRSFVGRRDAALMGFMVDTGWRVSEVLKVTVQMVRQGDLAVLAKGRKAISARLAPPVQEMLNRYLRVRPAARPELWLSRSGKAMDRNGVWEVLAYRSKAAAIRHVHPHMLRHTHAIWWLEDGGNVMDLKENLGHSSVRVTERYTRAMAQDRALKARAKFGPGYRLLP